MTTPDGKIVTHNALWPPIQTDAGWWKLEILANADTLKYLTYHFIGCDFVVGDTELHHLLSITTESLLALCNESELTKCSLLFASVYTSDSFECEPIDKPPQSVV